MPKILVLPNQEFIAAWTDDSMKAIKWIKRNSNDIILIPETIVSNSLGNETSDILIATYKQSGLIIVFKSLYNRNPTYYALYNITDGTQIKITTIINPSEVNWPVQEIL